MSNPYFSSDDLISLGSANRANVQGAYDKFLELHRTLHRRFRDHSWDLYPVGSKSDAISSHSTAAGSDINGLVMSYSRSREQAVLVERMMGREELGWSMQVDMFRHPVIEMRLTPTHFALELIVSAASWFDQQNLIGKLAVPRHRQALRTVIQGLPAETCIGFWKGVELDEMHVTASMLSRGTHVDEWVGTFLDGHDYLRVGMWYEPQSPSLDASTIASELTRRMDALYRMYTFLLWTSNNDFRNFYQKNSGYSSRDVRLS
jgi:hypothetical protein